MMVWWALAAAALGHVALWLRVVNHAHSFHWGGGLPHIISRVAVAVMAGGPIVGGWWYGREWWLAARTGSWPALDLGAWAYLAVTAGCGVWAVGAWGWRSVKGRKKPFVQQEIRKQVHLERSLGRSLVGPGPRKYWTKVPGNQLFELEICEKELRLPRLPKKLDGFVVAHLTDLHFVGTVDLAYYVEIVRLANAWKPDLAAVTGDLVDDDQYIDWTRETLGRLQARFGAYFVLGNHDLRIDHVRLRDTLTDCGLVGLGGKSLRLDVHGESVLLAGNERPWFGRESALDDFTAAETPGLGIALAHSPDQFNWARRHGFDLLLAGHTHGGQIRLPLVGPLWSPSHRGVTYSSGTFYKDPTVMHVSRGLSALTPLRINCRPELTKLVLRCGE